MTGAHHHSASNAHLPRANKASFRIDSGFGFLLLFLIVMNLPLWDPTLWADHDTATTYYSFFAFYNEFFFHRQLVRWLPFGTFGIQADPYQIMLSPGAYLVGLLGGLSGVKNTLNLFKLSVVFEQFTLLLGAYLLSGEWFARRRTRVFVCLGIVGGAVWIVQIWWNLRLYTLMPLVLYLLTRFFKQRQFHFLYLAAALFIFFHLVNTVYFAAINLIVVALFGLVLATGSRPPIRGALTPVRASAFSLLLLFAAGLLFAQFARHMLDYTSSHTIGRDTETGIVPLDNFLSFGEGIGWRKFLGLIYPGPVALESGLYAGTFPLLFFVYGLLRVRERTFLAVVLITAFLAAFSVGGHLFVAEAVYRVFPPIRYFRYIGQIGGLIRLFVLFGAGFGFDRFLTDFKQDRSGSPGARRTLGGTAIALLALVVLVELRNVDETLYVKYWPGFFYFSWVLFALMTLLMLLPRFPLRALATGILVCFTASMFFYQLHSFRKTPSRISWTEPDDANVYDYAFQPERTNDPPAAGRPRRAAKIVDSIMLKHTLAYNFMLTDPCISRFQTRFWPAGLEEFFIQRGGHLQYLFPPDRSTWPAFLSALSCGVPKLRFAADVVLTDDRSVAKGTFRAFQDIDKQVVVRVSGPQPAGERHPGTWQGPAGEIRVVSFTFNSLEVDVNVLRPDGAWLVYTDSYHPGWRAFIDREPAAVSEANLAFKTVFVGKGKHNVRFEYVDGAQGIASHLMAAAGILFSLMMIALGVKKLCFSAPR